MAKIFKNPLSIASELDKRQSIEGLPTPLYRDKNPDESTLKYREFLKQGKSADDIIKDLESINSEDFDYYDAADYANFLENEPRVLTSDYLDKVYDYYGGDVKRVKNEINKYDFFQNPYKLDEIINDYIADKNGKLAPINFDGKKNELRKSNLREAFDSYDSDPRMTFYSLRRGNYGLNDDELKNRIAEYGKIHEPYDKEKNDAYFNNPNSVIRGAYNYANDNIYEPRNKGKGTEYSLAKTNIGKLKEFQQNLNAIKPQNRYEESDLENVKAQIDSLVDLGSKKF